MSKITAKIRGLAPVVLFPALFVLMLLGACGKCGPRDVPTVVEAKPEATPAPTGDVPAAEPEKPAAPKKKAKKKRARPAKKKSAGKRKNAWRPSVKMQRLPRRRNRQKEMLPTFPLPMFRLKNKPQRKVASEARVKIKSAATMTILVTATLSAILLGQ